MRKQTQITEDLNMNQVIDNTLRELDELGLEEIEVIPELSQDLGIGKDNFDWLGDLLKTEH